MSSERDPGQHEGDSIVDVLIEGGPRKGLDSEGSQSELSSFILETWNVPEDD